MIDSYAFLNYYNTALHNRLFHLFLTSFVLCSSAVDIATALPKGGCATISPYLVLSSAKTARTKNQDVLQKIIQKKKTHN